MRFFSEIVLKLNVLKSLYTFFKKLSIGFCVIFPNYLKAGMSTGQVQDGGSGGKLARPKFPMIDSV